MAAKAKTGGAGIGGSKAFMTEFNENAQIVRQFIVPWLSLLIPKLPQIVQENTDLTTLNSDVGLIRDKLLYWESQLDDALATRMSADELARTGCGLPHPMQKRLYSQEYQRSSYKLLLSVL